MTVYLLHFDRPIAHAQHYLGVTDNLGKRLEQHRRGQGARFPAVCRERGIDFVVSRKSDGGRETERRLKRYHSGRKLCPICRHANPAA